MLTAALVLGAALLGPFDGAGALRAPAGSGRTEGEAASGPDDDGVDPALAALRAEVERVKPLVAAARGLAWKRDVKVEIHRAPYAGNPRWSGFYVGGSDTITIIDADRVGREFLVAHELAHALQDQHYGFARIDHGPRNTDEVRALRACTEGEAHLVAVGYGLRRLGLEGLVAAEDLPLRPGLIHGGAALLRRVGFMKIPDDAPASRLDPDFFPYTDGLVFVREVVRARGKGFAGWDGVLTDPPRSTEQILHPEKYLGPERDEPMLVDEPETPPGWTKKTTETLGEWGLRARLAERIPFDVAARAAAGWGGDRATEYAKGDEHLAYMDTIWDTQRDAEEFEAAARRADPEAEVRRAGRTVRVATGAIRRPTLF